MMFKHHLTKSGYKLIAVSKKASANYMLLNLCLLIDTLSRCSMK